MHADHDTAIRAALAQVRDDMRRVWSRCEYQALVHVVLYLELELLRAGHSEIANAINGGKHKDERLKRLLAVSAFTDELPPAIDRYLAGDEPWPAKETAT